MDILSIQSPPIAAPASPKPTTAAKLLICRESLSRSMTVMANSPGRHYRRLSAEKSKLSSLIPSTSTLSSSTSNKKISLRIAEITQHLNMFLSEPTLVFLKPSINIWLTSLERLTEDEIINQIGKLIFVLEFKMIGMNGFNIENDLELTFTTFFKNLFEELQKGETDRERRMNTTRAFSKIIISKKGRVNFGIIPSLLHLFEQLHSGKSGFIDNSTCFMENLLISGELRKQIESVAVPKKNNFSGKEIILSSLHLPLGKNIHAYHAKQCVVMACLSHPRQDDVGNCFALSVAISLFSSSIGRCIDDFREIIEYGYMKRVIEGDSLKFPALLRQPLSTVFKLLPQQIDEIKKNEKLELVLSLSHAHFPHTLPTSCTVDDLLLLLGEEVHQRARFLYESFSKNPLLSVWINILASMAEGKDDGIVKSAIINTCLLVAKENGVADQDLKKFKKQLLKKIYLHYDPSIQPLCKTEDRGAFILYDKTCSFVRIDTAEKFGYFICLAAENIKPEHWASNPNIIPNIVGLYGRGRYLEPAEIHAIDQEKKTPWKTELGNDPGTLLSTYENSAVKIPPIQFQPKNVSELFTRISDFWKLYAKEKNLLQNKRESLRPHTSLHIPTRVVSVHSFNLILNNDNFFNWIFSEPEKLLEERLNFAISQRELSEETVKSMETYIMDRNTGAKDKLFLANAPKETLQDYRNFLVTKYPPELIDRKLFDFLPEKTKSEMSSQSIHFGDSNMEVGNSDIHLVFCYNPASLKLEIFRAKDSGQLLSLSPQDEKKHMGTWEIISPLSPKV